MKRLTFISALLLATPVVADISDEANACIDELRERNGAVGGEILEELGSEAGTLVRLRDAEGVQYECIVWSGPEVAELRRVGEEDENADDGNGAMAGADASVATVSGTQQMKFAPGSSSASMTATLLPDTSVRYVLGARDGQFLDVNIASHGGALDYRILNPDGTNLLDLTSSDTPYKGQLWQSGDHIVEVVNAGAGPVTFDIGAGIE